MRIYRGIRNGKPGWIVDWTDSGKKRHRPWFKGESTARTFAASTREDIKTMGDAFTQLDTWEKALAAQCYLRAKGAGYSLVDACHAFETERNAGPLLTLAELQAKHWESRQKKNLRPTTLHQIRVIQKDLAETFAERDIKTITPAELETWLHRDEWGPVRQNKVLAEVSALFNYGVRFKYLAENPAKAVDKAIEDTKAPVIFQLVQIRRVMTKAQTEYPHLIPFLTVQLFGLCRRAEAERLTWEDLDLARGTIRVPAIKSKTRVPRLVPLNPTALDWLASFEGRRKGKLLKEKVERNSRYAAFRAACLCFKPNIVRHTALSYAVANTKDLAQVAYDGGTSIRELRDHYLNVVTKEDAEAFLRILPVATPRIETAEPAPKPWCRPGKTSAGIFRRKAGGGLERYAA